MFGEYKYTVRVLLMGAAGGPTLAMSNTLLGMRDWREWVRTSKARVLLMEAAGGPALAMSNSLLGIRAKREWERTWQPRVLLMGTAGGPLPERRGTCKYA